MLTSLLDSQLLVLPFGDALWNPKETRISVSLFVAATDGLFFNVTLAQIRAHSCFFLLFTLPLIQHRQPGFVLLRFAPRDTKGTKWFISGIVASAHGLFRGVAILIAFGKYFRAAARSGVLYCQTDASFIGFTPCLVEQTKVLVRFTVAPTQRFFHSEALAWSIARSITPFGFSLFRFNNWN